jgi:membrane associated rhomboid family serine protease
MFEDIKKDQNRKPIITYFIAIVSAVITLATIIFPDLYYVFGGLEGKISVFKIFSLPFQHGFDRITAIALLAMLLFFWISIASFVEKIMGPERFTYLVTSVIAACGVVQFFTGQPGHGLSPLVFAMIPVLLATMREVIDIKIGNSYDKVYKYLRVLINVFVLISVVLYSFLPIYFSYNNDNNVAEINFTDIKTTIASKIIEECEPCEYFVAVVNFSYDKYMSEPKKKKKKDTQVFSAFSDSNFTFLNVLKGIFFGNLFHLLGLLIGLSFAVKFKKRMGGTLTRFNKRKEFSEKDYKQAYIFIVLTSIYLVGLLLTSFFIEL